MSVTVSSTVETLVRRVKDTSCTIQCIIGLHFLKTFRFFVKKKNRKKIVKKNYSLILDHANDFRPDEFLFLTSFVLTIYFLFHEFSFLRILSFINRHFREF